MGISAGFGLAGAAVVLLAAFVAGMSGFGFAVVSVPLLLLLGMDIDEIVVVVLIVALAGRLPVLVMLRREIEARHVLWPAMCGCVPGLAVGAWASATVASGALEALAIAASLVAVAVSFLPVRKRAKLPSPGISRAVGFAGGFLGATTSLNGVPIAVALGRSSRSAVGCAADVAAYVSLTNVFAVAALALTGGPATSAEPYLLSLIWLLPSSVGNLLGARYARRLDLARSRQVNAGIVMLACASCIVAALL